MLVDILVWLIIGLVAGWLASIVMGTNAEQGPLTDIILGILGAFVGGFVMNLFGQGGVSGLNLWNFAVATVGAIVLIWIGRLFRRSNVYKHPSFHVTLP